MIYRGDKMTKIKVCGIICEDDIKILNEVKPEFAGFVMFYPKSRRNISPEKAKSLLKLLDRDIKSVAVTVSPSEEQIKIAAECGFDYIQIHGEAESNLIAQAPLPVLRAFNVTDIDKIKNCQKTDNIAGYVFDSHTPGSGKVFDWDILSDICMGDKMMILAGGLNVDNVLSAIKKAAPDVVDVSSGVECSNRMGKDREKIFAFVEKVRSVY